MWLPSLTLVTVLARHSFAWQSSSPSNVCPSDEPVTIKAPYQNPWAPLTKAETYDIHSWLYQQKDLNLTQFDKAGLSDNSIWLIEAISPNKTDILPYLDAHDKYRKRSTFFPRPAAPDRYARAVLFMGGEPIPYVKELQVGPLPISNHTSYSSLAWFYQNSTVPGVSGDGNIAFNSRTTNGAELNLIDAFIVSFMTKIKDATLDLFGGKYTGAADDNFAYSWQGPTSMDGSWRRLWLFWLGKGDGALYLTPIGFYVYLDVSGTDANQWYVRRVVYNQQIFSTIDEFNAAWKNGSLKRSPKSDITNTKWADRNKMGAARKLDDREAPRTATFQGSRIQGDKEAGYVEWMDWSFWIGFNRDTGLTLWDIRFKGERIIYEMSIQEAIAQYGGNDPVQASTAYLDRHYGIGEESTQLLAGYDCPIGALTLNGSWFMDGEYYVAPDAICIFEQDLAFPTSRHADTTNNWYGSTKGTALYVRTMASVYNYDYMFNYIFYLEGTVEVLVGASGYLQATYWDPTQNAYGTRIHNTTMGTIHTHVIGVKVDLDILGTANSLQTTDVVVEDVSPPWFYEDDGTGITRQLKLDRAWVPEETHFSIGNNGQTVLLIGNREKKNEWGLERMYRVMPGYHTIHNPVVGAPVLLNNAKWSEDDVYVIVRKDSESSSSSTWNQQLPYTPPVDFSKFWNPPESIDQEDLVVYLNLGMHHVPRSEDTPNTLFTDTRSSWIISPFNYFNDEPSRDIRNAILLQKEDNAAAFAVVEPGSGDDAKACLLQNDKNPLLVLDIISDLASS